MYGHCMPLPTHPQRFCDPCTCFTGLSVFLPGSLKLGGESPECSVKKITKERPEYQLCQVKLRHLDTFLQSRLLFHKPHSTQTVHSLYLTVPGYHSPSLISLPHLLSTNPCLLPKPKKSMHEQSELVSFCCKSSIGKHVS